MDTKNQKDGYLLKSDVILMVQECIEKNGQGRFSGIPQLYDVLNKIKEMPAHYIDQNIEPVKNEDGAEPLALWEQVYDGYEK